MMDQLEKLGIKELHCLYETKRLSPVEVCKHLFKVIHAKNPPINAFVHLMEESAMWQAREAQERMMAGRRKSTLDGVPIAIKDIIDIAGIPTTGGCAGLRGNTAEGNAVVTERLLEQGAVLIGKTNTHQLAVGCTGDRSCFGPVCNPCNRQRMTGGSSSGSAAALASFMVPAALGSDTGGSIRLPASFCGVVGIKPTYGNVPLFGAMEVCAQSDNIGPMTRGVEDNALLLNGIAGYDKRDIYSVDHKKVDYTRFIREPISGKTVGVPRALFAGIIDPKVEERLDECCRAFEKEGAQVKIVRLPALGEYREAQKLILHYHALRAKKHICEAHRQDVDEEVMKRLLSGDCSAEEYRKAEIKKAEFRTLFKEALQSVDALLLPATGVTAPEINQRVICVNGVQQHIYEQLTGFLWQASFAQVPAISVPCGKIDGMPIGVQLVASAWEEDRLYQFAVVIEDEYRISI